MLRAGPQGGSVRPGKHLKGGPREKSSHRVLPWEVLPLVSCSDSLCEWDARGLRTHPLCTFLICCQTVMRPVEDSQSKNRAETIPATSKGVWLLSRGHVTRRVPVLSPHLFRSSCGFNESKLLQWWLDVSPHLASGLTCRMTLGSSTGQAVVLGNVPPTS